MTDPTRGVLYPERLPTFTRVEASAAATELVAWCWIPQWDLPSGVESRQRVLPYPAGNLVVEAGRVTLWGATTRASERVLRGRGWAVGAMLRPAAYARLSADPASLVDASVELDAPELAAAVDAAMPDAADASVAMERWILERVGVPTGEGRLANAMAALLAEDAAILRVEDAAARLAVSTRTLQRSAHRFVGVSPAAMIRRRRLQEAAQRMREDPELLLSTVAAELGYADHAHLSSDFRSVLGVTPSSYRSSVAD